MKTQRSDSDLLCAVADVRKFPRAKRRELDRKYRERAKRLDNYRTNGARQ